MFTKWIYESRRGHSVEEVIDEMQQTNQQVLTVLEALADDVRIERIDPAFHLLWIDGERFLAGEFFHHFHDDHKADVRAWLARQTGNPED